MYKLRYLKSFISFLPNNTDPFVINIPQLKITHLNNNDKIIMLCVLKLHNLLLHNSISVNNYYVVLLCKSTIQFTLVIETFYFTCKVYNLELKKLQFNAKINTYVFKPLYFSIWSLASNIRCETSSKILLFVE